MSLVTDARNYSTMLYWSENTDDCLIETGIQRVVRNLALGLRNAGVDLVNVRWDSARRLPRLGSSTRDGAYHDWSCQEHSAEQHSWLLVPEITDTLLSDGLDPVQVGKSLGLKVAAIVHDMIPMKYPDLYSGELLAIFRQYYRMFADADLILATTNYVVADFRAYMTANGLPVPPIVIIPLPAQLAATERCRAAKPFQADTLKLLTVSTWEPRKNLPRLLRALQRAKTHTERRIDLTLVGWRGLDTGYIAEVDALVADMDNVAILDWVDTETLVSLYGAHDVSIYPSWEEGFGMPILESLWMATPCVCHSGSSMGEIAPGGGTLLIDMTDEDTIFDVICRLAEDSHLVATLALETTQRRLHTWAEYAGAVYSALDTHR